MKRLALLLPLTFLLSACSIRIITDNGRQITDSYTNSDGTHQECVIETEYVPGGHMVTPGGVIIFPSYRKPLSRECVTNRKQNFTTSQGPSLSTDERQAKLLGLSVPALVKLRILMSQETPGEKARLELQSRGVSQSDLLTALALAVDDKPILVEKVVNNATYKVVSEYLGTTPEILFTALRFISAALQVEMQIQRGLRIEQSSAYET